MRRILARSPVRSVACRGFTLVLVALVAQSAGAHLVYCKSSGQQCDASFSESISVDTRARFSLTLGAPERQCSVVSYTLLLDGRVVGKTDFLKAGTQQRFDLGILEPGDYTYEVHAEGKKGRCNTGTLESWAADHWLDWEIIPGEGE